MEHPEFTLKNPNRLRSVVSVFIGSPQFHLADGSGYDFALEMIPKAGRAVGARRVSSCQRKVARVKRRALCSGGRPEPPGGGGHGQRRLPDLAKVGPRPAGADPREAEGPAEDEPRTREKIQAWYLWAGFKGKPKCYLIFFFGGRSPLARAAVAHDFLEMPQRQSLKGLQLTRATSQLEKKNPWEEAK